MRYSTKLMSQVIEVWSTSLRIDVAFELSWTNAPQVAERRLPKASTREFTFGAAQGIPTRANINHAETLITPVS
jgi:hypothetical protein